MCHPRIPIPAKPKLPRCNLYFSHFDWSSEAHLLPSIPREFGTSLYPVKLCQLHPYEEHQPRQ